MSQRKRKAVTPPPKQRRNVWPLVIGAAAVASALIAIAVAAEPDAVSTPGTGDPAIVAEGATIFAANCATCHGADLRGTATGPPLLHQYYAPNHHGDEAFQRAVAFGVVAHHWNFGDMAPLPHLTREEVAKVVAFVRTQQEAAGILFDPGHG
ncbi:MAG TPA: cytochrome C [Actinobacteria bacterium]|nr:cytochrome C [Actinomycetota bacterium]